jgi:hypothetical protein
MTAARATRLIMSVPDPRGYEVILPRKVKSAEIHALRAVNRVVGWRYYPEAKGRRPCGCPVCTRGEIKAKRLRAAFERAFRRTSEA